MNIKKAGRGLLSNKRLVICCLIIGSIFAGTLVIGCHMSQSDSLGDNLWLTAFEVVVLIPFMSCLAALVLLYYDRVSGWMRRCRAEMLFSRYMDGSRRFFLCIWILIFLFWVPMLISAFPGIYDIDGAYQIMWFRSGKISAHHPVLHTYLLGICVDFGKWLFGSDEAGLLCYSLFQMLCMSAVFAYINKQICGRIPRVLQSALILSYILLPYYGVLSITTTKDVLFAGIFAIWVLKTYECVTDRKSFFGSGRRQAAYVGIIFLMCALRNTGYYIFLFMLFFFLLICRSYWRNILCIGLATVILWGIFTGPVYKILGVIPGSEAEALSVPMQQFARVMAYDGDTVSSKDRELIIQYIPDYERYTPRVSDSVKDRFNGEAFQQNKAEFIKLWARVGMEHPIVYLEAFLSTNIGFWYPNMRHPDEGAFLSYIVYDNTEYKGEWPEIKRTSYVSSLSEFYRDFTQEGKYHEIPGLYVFYSAGLMFWMICLCLGICIYKRNYMLLVPLSILVGLWGTLMLSPVVVFRYAYPLFTAFPVMLCICGEKAGAARSGDLEGRQKV